MSRRHKNENNQEKITIDKNGSAEVQDSAEMTTDAFSNPLFQLGYGSQSPLEATEYPLTRMTDNYALLNSLYRDNWVVQNVISLVVDDMLRERFTVDGMPPDKLEEINAVIRRTKLWSKIKDGLSWGRLYGGAAGLIMIRGQETMLDTPLDMSTVMPDSFCGLYIIDRWCGVQPDMQLISDMSDPDFGLPEYYTINSPENKVVARVHHSRIVRFTGRELPYLEKLAELYWGESEIEALYRDVVAHDNVSANMAALTFQANLTTMEVDNLDQLFSVGSAHMQQRFWQTMQAQSVLRTNYGMQAVKTGTNLKNTQYNFSGLDNVYEAMALNLCGASHYPMTKLFGRSPSGLNSTGESDLQNYYDYTDSLREAKLRPVLEKILPVICMSLWGVIPDNLAISFPPLWTPTAKEIAAIAKDKTAAILDVFQAGLLNADTAQKELKNLSAETGLFGALADDEIEANRGRSYQDLTALRDPLSGLVDYDTVQTQATTDALTFDYNHNHDPSNGRFTNGGGSGKIKSPKLGKRERKRVSSEILTNHPEYKKGETHGHFYGKNYYVFNVEGAGDYKFTSKIKIEGNEQRIKELERILYANRSAKESS